MAADDVNRQKSVVRGLEEVVETDSRRSINEAWSYPQSTGQMALPSGRQGGAGESRSWWWPRQERCSTNNGWHDFRVPAH